MKKDIICLAFPAWEGNYLKSTVQLMKELAQGNRVLYVDYAYTWKDLFNSVRGKGFANWQRMLGIKPRLRTETLDNGGTIHILALPPVLPTNFIKNVVAFDTLNALNAYFIEKIIKKAQRTLGINTPSVVNAFNPIFGVHLAGKLNETKLIYYCYDEISAATWANRHGARLETLFLKRVDTVIVTSQGLFDKKSKQHPHCLMIKNGVDFDLFAAENPKPIAYPTPSKTANYTKIIGYLGSVDERLDYDLMENVIKMTPQYQYLFVGRVTKTAYQNRLSALENVILMGAQAPDTLPAWVKKFDVCWIPFIKNDLTAGIYPLKINEYLAAGKPVVSTNFSDLSDFTYVISIADTPKMMCHNFQQSHGNATNRRAFAAQNAWRARAEDFVEVM